MSDYEYKTRIAPASATHKEWIGKTHIINTENKYGTLCNIRTAADNGKWVDHIPGNSVCRLCIHVRDRMARQ